MCWRERFLTLCSSLITYTRKEFVYVIIFSLTASPKAAMIQVLSAGRPSPLPRSLAKQAPRARTRKGALLCHQASPSPAPNPAALASPCANSPCRKMPPPASATNPPARALHLTYGGGASLESLSALPGSRDHHRHAAPGGMCPASAVRVKLMRNPALGAAPWRHKASVLQGSFSNAEGKGLIQSETPRKRRPFLFINNLYYLTIT